MLKKIILVVVILIVVGLGAVYFARNVIAESAVEEGSKYALGVQTDLGSASVDIGGGSLGLAEFTISNPEGFSSDKLMTMNHGFLDVETGSVFDDEVVVDSLVLESFRLRLEQQNTKSNVMEVLNHIKQVDFGSEQQQSQQKFRIKKLMLRDIGVDASLTVEGNEQYQKSYTVSDITLTDVGSDGGASIGQITAQVVRAVLQKSAASGRGVLPEEFNAPLNRIADQSKESIKEKVTDKIEDVGKSLLGDDGD